MHTRLGMKFLGALVAVVPSICSCDSSSSSSSGEPSLDPSSSAPKILSATIDEEHDTLVLNGSFGDDNAGQHTVTVDALDLTGKATWTPSRISIVGLPRSGQGSHGDIVVTLRGTSKSNTFTLSEWRGDFKIQNPVSEGAGTVDTLFTEATVSAHIRFVFDPATVGKTSALKGPFTAAFDTKVVVKTGGQHTDATKDETWALNGAADVTYASIVASPDRYAFMTGNVDPTVWPLKMDMAVNIQIKDGLTKTVTANGKTQMTNDYLNVKTGPQSVPLTFDENFSIQPGSYKDASSRYIVSWDAIPAVSPPKPTP